MKRIVVVAFLLALGGCFYAPWGGSSGSAIGAAGNDAGGPGPGNIPTNPSGK